MEKCFEYNMVSSIFLMYVMSYNMQYKFTIALLCAGEGPLVAFSRWGKVHWWPSQDGGRSIGGLPRIGEGPLVAFSGLGKVPWWPSLDGGRSISGLPRIGGRSIGGLPRMGEGTLVVFPGLGKVQCWPS